MTHVPGPDLTGKVALVTGASSGIGRACAIAFGQAGADVATQLRPANGPAESAAEEIRKLGRKAILLPVDVSDQTAVEAMVEKTTQGTGQRGHLLVVGRLQRSRAVPHGEHDRLSQDDRGIAIRRLLLPAGMHQSDDQTGPGRGDRHHFVAARQNRVPECDGLQHRQGRPRPDGPAQPQRSCSPPHSRQHPLSRLDRYAGRTKILLGGNDQGSRQASCRPVVWRPPRKSRMRAIFLVDPRSDYINGATLEIEGGLALPWWSNRDKGDF